MVSLEELRPLASDVERLFLREDRACRGKVGMEAAMRIFSKELGLVHAPRDVSIFLSNYVDDELGGVDYEALVARIRSARVFMGEGDFLPSSSWTCKGSSRKGETMGVKHLRKLLERIDSWTLRCRFFSKNHSGAMELEEFAGLVASENDLYDNWRAEPMNLMNSIAKNISLDGEIVTYKEVVNFVTSGESMGSLEMRKTIKKSSENLGDRLAKAIGSLDVLTNLEEEFIDKSSNGRTLPREAFANSIRSNLRGIDETDVETITNNFDKGKRGKVHFMEFVDAARPLVSDAADFDEIEQIQKSIEVLRDGMVTSARETRYGRFDLRRAYESLKPFSFLELRRYLKLEWKISEEGMVALAKRLSISNYIKEMSFEEFRNLFMSIERISVTGSPTPKAALGARSPISTKTPWRRSDLFEIAEMHSPVPLKAAEKDEMFESLQRSSSPKTRSSLPSIIEKRLRELFFQLAQNGNGTLDLNEAFLSFDKGRTGLISNESFIRSLKRVGFKLSNQESKELLRCFGSLKSGYIDFPAFESFYRNSETRPRPSSPCKKRINAKHQGFIDKCRKKLRGLRVGPSFKRQFERFDKNRSGKLSKQEMQRMLISLGIKATRLEFEHLFSQIDVNDDGKVSLSDFEAFLKTHRAGSRSLVEQNAKTKLYMSKKDLRAAFLALDRRGSYKVNRQQFESALLEAADDLDEEELKCLFNACSSGAEFISYPAFLVSFIDREKILRQFNGRQHSSNATFQGIFAKFSSANERITFRACMRGLTQMGVTIPAWQVQSAFDLIREEDKSKSLNSLDSVSLSRLCQIFLNGNCPGKVEQPSNIKTYLGTVASLAVEVRSRFASSRMMLTSLSCGAVQNVLNMQLSKADLHVLQKLVEMMKESSGNLSAAILSCEFLELAFQVDQETDRDAIILSKRALKTIKQELQDRRIRHSKQAFSFLKGTNKALDGMKLTIDEIDAFCHEIGLPEIGGNPWAMQFLLWEFCSRRFVVFERSLKTYGISYQDFQAFATKLLR